MPTWLSSIRFPFFTRAVQPPPRIRSAASPKEVISARRKATRKLLANVVSEGMLRTGVLSHQFKFKMLALDKSGDSFYILIEVAPEAEEVGEYRQGQCELWVRQTAAFLHQIKVVSVFWRREREPGILGKPVIATPLDGGLSETHYAGLEA